MLRVDCGDNVVNSSMGTIDTFESQGQVGKSGDSGFAA